MEEHLWVFSQPTEETISELRDAGAISRPTALVLAGRNITSVQVESFLRPSLSCLGDPYSLPGTEAAAARLWKAIRQGERILIHGDYDTDGITATALTAWILRKHGAKVGCFLPHRIDNGYGLNTDSIRKAKQEKWDLMITVDCGITSVEPAEEAMREGIDLIITDHHMPGPTLPEAVAVVDPKIPGSPPEVQNLAGVGVAFKVCHAFLKYGKENRFGCEADLRVGLDLVALGTVADIVPLLDENRILVKNGLQVLARQQRPGIHALCEIARTSEPLATSDITYRLAPRINAAGRMGDPADSLKLLEASSMGEASRMARRLDEYNQERQRIEETAITGAERQIAELYDIEKRRTIVVAGSDWHQGVIGIVASRLTRRYRRPSVVLTQDQDGLWIGSSRSIRELSLIDLLDRCGDCLIRFGGHAMAAGLSLEPGRLEEFREIFEQVVKETVAASSMQSRVESVGEVAFGELDYRFFSELEKLEPFGHGNPEPIFVTRNVSPDRLFPAGQNHTRGYLRDGENSTMPFIAFGRTPECLPPPPWDVAYTPQMNHYNGNATPQARIVDIKPV